MLQQVMTEPGKIEFREIAKPEIEENQVLIKMMRIGVCGSDIHVYHGKHPYTSYPVVQGHEVSGEIVETGTKVDNLSAGDKVTVLPQVVCGECYPCQNGRYNICEELKVRGFQTTGMASEYFAVDKDKVLKVADDLSFDQISLVEPLAVAVHALKKGENINNRDLLVLGAGPIGNLVAQAAKGMGANEVMITEISEYRRKIAEKCGIDYCINPVEAEIEEELVNNFGTKKADKILECVGVNQTIDQAVEVARKGTDIIVVGVFGEKPEVDLGLVQDRELRLIGTLMYKKEDYEKAIELIEQDKIKLDPLITDHFNFRDYIKAYEYIEEQNDEVMKVIVNVEQK